MELIAFHKFADGGGSDADDPGWNASTGVLNNDSPTYTHKRAYCDLASEWGYSPCGL